MNLESIYLVLSESYRKALIAFVACTLIVYPLLYFGLPSFQSLEWYTQILISSGFGISYVGTFACFYIPVMKHSDAFLLSVALLSIVSLLEWLKILQGSSVQWIHFLTVLTVLFFLGFFLFLILGISGHIRGSQQTEEPTK